MNATLRLQGHRKAHMRDDTPTKNPNSEVTVRMITAEEWNRLCPDKPYPGVNGFNKPREPRARRDTQPVVSLKQRRKPH